MTAATSQQSTRAPYGSKTPGWDMLSTGQLSYRSRKLNQAVEDAPQRKECPKCHRTRDISKFGFRTHRYPVGHELAGQIRKVEPQSNCTECRSGKVVPSTKKGAEAKTKTERKVRKQVKAGKAAIVETAPEGPAPVIGDSEPAPEAPVEKVNLPAPMWVEGAAPEAEAAPAPVEAIREQPAVETPVVDTTPVPTEEPVAVQPPAPAVKAPVLKDGEKMSKCGEILVKGVMCACDVCMGRK